MRDGLQVVSRVLAEGAACSVCSAAYAAHAAALGGGMHPSKRCLSNHQMDTHHRKQQARRRRQWRCVAMVSRGHAAGWPLAPGRPTFAALGAPGGGASRRHPSTPQLLSAAPHSRWSDYRRPQPANPRPPDAACPRIMRLPLCSLAGPKLESSPLHRLLCACACAS